jgi:hypothetical protein
MPHRSRCLRWPAASAGRVRERNSREGVREKRREIEESRVRSYPFARFRPFALAKRKKALFRGDAERFDDFVPLGKFSCDQFPELSGRGINDLDPDAEELFLDFSLS